MYKIIKNYKSLLILLGSIVLGGLLGIIFKEKVVFLKPLGDIFLNLMFTLAVPLIFFTVISSVANMNNLNKLGKIIKSSLIVFIITSLIAGIVMFVILKIFNPVQGSILLEQTDIEVVDIGSQIVKAITVNDFQNLFSKNSILPLIIFSILFGISLSLIGEKALSVKNGINILSNVIMKMIKLVMYYAPIGLCAYFAALVGEYGRSIIDSYAKSIILYYIVSILYFVIFYTVYAYIADRKKGVKSFWKNVLPSFMTSLATQSSLATLPVNMEVLDEMKISKDVSRVTCSLGSTMHMEGSSMGAILKIMFVFSLLNRPFNSIGDIMLGLIIAVMSAVVMAGVPGGGLIGETLIISMYGLPKNIFGVIATIGILIDPPATMLNATGDILSAMLIDKKILKSGLHNKEKMLT